MSSKEKEIVLIVGYPASGKSSLAVEYEQNGYERLNRDILGGTIDSLNKKLEEKILSGGNKFVLDNLYPSVESRKPLIDIAKRHKFDIKAAILNTSIEDSQFNASSRMVKKYGRLLGPDSPEDKDLSKGDPNAFMPVVQFAFKKNYIEPSTDEGFTSVTKTKFVRNLDKKVFKNKALFLDYDGCLRETISGEKYPVSKDDIRILPNRSKILQKYLDDGYILLGVSNQSGVGKGIFTKEECAALFEATNQKLGHKIDVAFCPHNINPAAGIPCFCRKPMPGLFVQFMHKYNLDPEQCIFVGDLKTDQTASKRFGCKFVFAEEFFKDK